MIQLGNAKWTRRNAIPAAVAHVVLDNHGPKFGTDDSSGGTRVEAPGMDTMFADVTEHEPGNAVWRWLLHERDVPPRGSAKINGVVITETSQIADAKCRIARKLVPLLASDLTSLATDTQRGVSKEP